jgi:electron transfer flavoprotein alpha subunit
MIISKQYRGICIYVEYTCCDISATTCYLLNIGQNIAIKLKVSLNVIIIGYHINKHITQKYINLGADNVYVCDNVLLHNFQDNTYSNILLRIIQTIQPEILIFSATNISIVLASIIAANFYTGITSNCISLDIDLRTRNLKQITTDFKTILTPTTRPQIVTIQPKIFNKVHLKYTPNRIGKIINFQLNTKDICNKIKIINRKKYTVDNIFEDLTNANIIVAVGRGVHNYKIFKLIKEFTTIIHGKLGASKYIVDLGWVPPSCQIGETGISISPKLYIACGISGKKQHTIGINLSSTIVSINIDPNCYMMQIADFALQGDLYDIITQFVSQLQKNSIN